MKSKFAVLSMVLTALLAVALPARRALAAPEFCCVCDCKHNGTKDGAGGAAGFEGDICFDGFGAKAETPCESACGAYGCGGELVYGACSSGDCAITNPPFPFGITGTNPAPAFGPIGAALAALAAGLGGAWSILRRRASS